MQKPTVMVKDTDTCMYKHDVNLQAHKHTCKGVEHIRRCMHAHTCTHACMHACTHTHTCSCITTARIGYVVPIQGVSQQKATRLVALLAAGTPTSSSQLHGPLSAVGVHTYTHTCTHTHTQCTHTVHSIPADVPVGFHWEGTPSPSCTDGRMKSINYYKYIHEKHYNIMHKLWNLE